MPRALIALIFAPIGVSAAPAHAAPGGVDLSLEGTTDSRERGLSWSAGKPALTLSAAIPVSYDLGVEVEAMTLRDSARHGGADLGLAIAPRYTVQTGGWTLAGGARGHVFAGRSGLSYVELTADAAYSIGPARLVAGIDYAPSQNAIGGDNLHVEAQAQVGIPGTPLTAFGSIGHTSGSPRTDPRAWRLRPGGSYTDHQIGLEHASNRLTVGVLYSGTSIGSDEVDRTLRYVDRHYGERLSAYIRVSA